MDNNLHLINHPTVKAYAMHGFIPTGENETQIYGRCPFCNHLQHNHSGGSFYVGKLSKNKNWDCKSCGKNGGFKTFLEEMDVFCKELFSGIKAIELSKAKNIKISTLRKYVGYNRLTDKFCIPIYSIDKDIIDFRIYSGKHFLSTFSCHSTLFNWVDFKKSSKIVYICEGEWDTMVMMEILTTLKLDAIVIGLPGATIFKPDWIELFKNKSVRVLLDNDKAGNQGSLKIFNFLKQVVDSIQFVNWGEAFKNGYDIRDLYKDKKLDTKITLENIESLLSDYPSGVDIECIEVEPTENYNGEGLSAKQVYKVYQENLHLPDTKIIDFLYGSIIGNRLEGHPLWSFIVAPSGFTKSALIMSISNAKNIHTEDNLSMAGLVSGYTATGVDMSLVSILDGKILAIKDLTTLLSIRQDERAALFGALRSISDGVYKHRFGNVHRRYEAKFGILAGVTPKIEVFLENESALGERFLRYGISLPETMEEELLYLDKSMNNMETESIIQKNLSEVAIKCIDYDYKDITNFTKENLEKIKYLSLWISIMRGGIERDKYTKDILYKPFREIGTRIVKQILKLTKGICMFRNITRPGKNEIDLLNILAKGTVPSRMNDILEICYNNSIDSAYTPRGLSKMIKLSEPVCDMVCKNFYMLDVFKRQQLEMKTEYYFSENFIKIINASGVYDK